MHAEGSQVYTRGPFSPLVSLEKGTEDHSSQLLPGLPVLRSKERELPATSIPRIIHQMWLGGGQPSKRLIEQSNTLREMNGVKHVMWRDSEVYNLFSDHDSLRKYAEFYSSLKHTILRCDFARYAIMYVFGGLYIDLDIVSREPLPDSLWEREILLFFEDEVLSPTDVDSSVPIFNRVLVGTFGSRPLHPFWLHLMDKIVRECMYREVTSIQDIFMMTGPHMMAMHTIEYTKQNCSDILDNIFPYDSRGDTSTFTFNSLFRNDSHLGKDWQMKLLIDLWWRVLLIVVIAIIAVLVVVGLLFSLSRRGYLSNCYWDALHIGECRSTETKRFRRCTVYGVYVKPLTA